jgi:hypothetical protein
MEFSQSGIENTRNRPIIGGNCQQSTVEPFSIFLACLKDRLALCFGISCYSLTLRFVGEKQRDNIMRIPRALIFNNLLLVPFVVLSLLAVFNHEPWRDQTHTYVNIGDLGSFVEAMRYSLNFSAEGPLQAIIYWCTFQFSHDFLTIQLLWWLFMLAAMLLVANASLSRWYEKILISLGYFLLYDYCVVAGRPYVLTALLLISILTLYPWRSQYPKTICLLVGIMALAGFWGIVFCIFFSVLLAFDFRINKRSFLPFAIILGLLCLGIFFVADRPGNVKTGQAIQPLHLESAYIVVKGVLKTVFLTVPSTKMIWFPHIFVEHPHQSLALALLFLALLLCVAPRRLFPGAFFWLAGGAILGSFVLANHAAIRYVGMLYLVLLAGIWLDRLYQDRPNWFSIPFLHHPGVIQAAFLVILLFQAWSGVNAVIIDYKHPFSGSKEAGAWLDGELKGKDPNKALIATFGSSYAMAIIPYLHSGNYSFYSIEMRRPYRRVPTNREWYAVEPNSYKYTFDEILQRFVAEINTGKYTDVYLISFFPMNIRFSGGAYMRPVYECRTDTMTADERFFIYQFVATPK